MRTFFLTLVLVSSVFGGGRRTPQEALAKDEVKILITDSGLGGLSVAADFDRRLRATGQFKKAEIIFANALPGGKGYNDMSSTEEKAKVFSAALQGMAAKFDPDVIVIACNTLSVVYPYTEFSRTAAIPVVGIIEIATALFTTSLNRDPDASVIIFGTETTIESGEHKEQLLKNGVADSRIVTQACPKLESEIQTDASSDMVQTYIDWYVEEATENLTKTTGMVFAGLCCTHYGYSEEIFLASLKSAGVTNAVIINPNTAMAAAVLPAAKKRHSDAAVTVRVVSRVPISEEEIVSIAALVRKDSEQTAQSLEQYNLDCQLFPYADK